MRRRCLLGSLLGGLAVLAPLPAPGGHEGPGLAPRLVGASLVNGWARARQDPVVVDVRSPGKYAALHIAGALNLPLSEIRRGRRSGMPRTGLVMLY